MEQLYHQIEAAELQNTSKRSWGRVNAILVKTALLCFEKQQLRLKSKNPAVFCYLPQEVGRKIWTFLQCEPARSSTSAEEISSPLTRILQQLELARVGVSGEQFVLEDFRITTSARFPPPKLVKVALSDERRCKMAIGYASLENVFDNYSPFGVHVSSLAFSVALIDAPGRRCELSVLTNLTDTVRLLPSTDPADPRPKFKLTLSEPRDPEPGSACSQLHLFGRIGGTFLNLDLEQQEVRERMRNAREFRMECRNNEVYRPRTTHPRTKHNYVSIEYGATLFWDSGAAAKQHMSHQVDIMAVCGVPVKPVGPGKRLATGLPACRSDGIGNVVEEGEA
ncbi:unnamed protein product [Amoebophrya sp. A120]|nr:unnamed protein product [Amoebophrya sp. A120]|eukprot:GSA120T00020806001.1